MVLGLPVGRGRCSHSQVQPDCTVMLTAAAEVPPAPDVPGSAEPQWAWVSPGVGRMVRVGVL